MDRALQESADTYVSLHQQLSEELPIFISIISDCLDLIVAKIVEIQISVFGTIQKAFGNLGFGRDNILEDFMTAFDVGGPLELASREIQLYTRWRIEIFSKLPERDFIRTDLVEGQPASPEVPSPASEQSIPLIDLGSEEGSPIQSKPLSSMPLAIAKPPRTRLHKSPVPTASPHLTELNGARIALESFEVIVIYPFKAETFDELSLSLGSVVVVSRVRGRGGDQDESWWFGEITRTGENGWFPCSFVQRR